MIANGFDRRTVGFYNSFILFRCEAVLKLKKAEEVFLQHSRVCRVATVNARGMPHVVPVCPLWERNRLYFGTERNSKKIRNLRQNGQIALVVDDYSEAWAHLRGLLLHGNAELLGHGAEFRRIRKLLYRKFPQYEAEAPLEDGEAVIVCVTPSKAVSWGL